MGLGKELLSLLEKDQWFVCEISRSGDSRHGIPFDLARTGEIDDLIRRVSNVSPEDLLAPRAVAGAIMDLVRDDRFADFRFDAKSHLGA